MKKKIYFVIGDDFSHIIENMIPKNLNYFTNEISKFSFNSLEEKALFLKELVILGKNATLFNAGKGTNFIYKINGINQDIANRINLIESQPKIKNRIDEIRSQGFSLVFDCIESNTFELNLKLISNDLPLIIAESLLFKYSRNGKTTIQNAVMYLNESNPLNLDLSKGHPFYEFRFKKFLTDVALGMTPSKIWTGQYDATGGIIIVKSSGEIVCYHLYYVNQFQEYLYKHTRIEQSGTGRYDYGYIYEFNKEFYLKLNLQIRFD